MPESELSNGNPEAVNSSGNADATTEVPSKKAIADVHKQLTNGFQPAVKSVAEAGVNLLRAFNSLQKSADTYIKTVQALANSGNNAFSDGKEAASELEKVASRMKSVQERHEENIDLFSKLVAKMNSFSQEEKDILKDLHRGFRAREKAMKKAIHKGQKNEDEFQQFYAKELQFAVKEQQRRYQFFVDKHSEWLYSYVNFLQFMKECCHYENKEENLNEETSEDKNAENTTNSEEGKHEFTNEGKASEQEEEHKNDLEKESVKKTEAMNGVLTQSYKTAGTQTKEDLDDVGAKELQGNQRVMKQPEREKEQIPPWQLRMSADADRLQQATTETEAEPRNVQAPITSEARPESPIRIDANTKNKREFRGTEEYENYRRPISTVQPKYYSSQSNLSSDQNRLSAAAEDDEFKPSHLNQIRENGVMFRPQNVTAVPTAFIPPAFVPADYGKLLICVHDFQGRTASQLSLRAGERVVLIKSGSKGWIFAKNVNNQRTGWFPSRFVKLLPEDEAVSSS